MSMDNQLFHQFLDQNPIPAAVTSMEGGVVLEVNEAAVRLSGYRREGAPEQGDPGDRAVVDILGPESGFLEN
jgi:PAS domain-containing protein